MSVTVTGSEGYIGSWLCHLLKIPQDRRFDIITSPEHDITKKKARKKIVETDVIVHLAAISGIKECEDNPELAYETNHVAVVELAKLAKQRGVNRFILASSASVYGETSKYLMNENHSTNPRATYGKTKLLAENVLKLADKSFSVLILRKSNVYGYGMRWKGRTVVDQFINKFLVQRPIEVTGNGHQKRDYLHLGDAARVYAQLTNLKCGRSGIYNLGGDQVLSVSALAELVNKIGEAIYGYRVGLSFKEDSSSSSNWHDFKYDISKAMMEFQYSPQFTLDDYIKERFLLEARK